jgi:hypothetical protein
MRYVPKLLAFYCDFCIIKARYETLHPTQNHLNQENALYSLHLNFISKYAHETSEGLELNGTHQIPFSKKNLKLYVMPVTKAE